MKKIYLSLLAAIVAVTSLAQGWPGNYSGVMLQGFYWDSYDVTNWQKFIDRSDELSGAFDLIWVPNSATVSGGGESMGYMPLAWLRHTTRFGTEAQLLEMIDVFRGKNTGFIEDVVLNHKAANVADDGTYRKFYNESKDGYVLEWDNTDFTGIVSNDDVPGGGNPDTGDGFDGARDLDHTNALVQKNCITYQQFLMQYIGYVGFRLDMVKGYDGKYNGMYNAASGPAFCVGEYWDGYDNITNWMKRTTANGAIQSGAFDFPFKYAINEAFDGGNWNKLTTDGVVLDPSWRRYTVTFVDNHDTRREMSTLNKYREDATVLILSLPGTPCVLIQDFDDYKENITKMIAIRRAVGITNTSEMEIIPWDNNKGCQFFVTGKYGHLRIDLGDAVNLGAPEGMKLALSTTVARVYIDEGIDPASGKKEPMVFGQPFFSVPSGVYSEPFTVRVGPSVRGATFVYTTDGTDPTPKSPKLDKVTELTIDKNTTIIGGILIDGAVTRLAKQNYIISDNVPTNITVYVKASSAPNLYAWDDKGQLNGDWPGKAMSETATVGGVTWYKQSFKKSGDDYKINAIFNTGNEGVQTVDLTDIRSDVFYVFTPGEGSASAKDVTALYLNALYNPTVSIDRAGGEYAGAFTANVTASNPEATIVYTLDGNDPTATVGTKATGKAAIKIPANATTTLKAGVLLNGQVQNIVSATYVTKNGTVESGINVYVLADEAPYLYTWDANGEQHNGVWPGTQMNDKRTVQGKTFYYQHFDVSSLNIIFNCGTGGEGNQTKDINGLTAGDHYYTYDGGGNYEDVTSQYGGSSDTSLPSCAKWVDGSWFVYFENNAGYVDPHIWCWGENNAQFTGSDWPGTALVAQVGMSASGNPVYRWTYGNKTLTPTGLLFSDGGAPQTSDFAFVNGGYYNASGLVGTVKDTGIEDITPAVDRQVKSVRYYNLMGMPSDKPYEGLNIIVTTYSDGTTSAVKQLR